MSWEWEWVGNGSGMDGMGWEWAGNYLASTNKRAGLGIPYTLPNQIVKVLVFRTLFFLAECTSSLPAEEIARVDYNSSEQLPYGLATTSHMPYGPPPPPRQFSSIGTTQCVTRLLSVSTLHIMNISTS